MPERAPTGPSAPTADRLPGPPQATSGAPRAPLSPSTASGQAGDAAEPGAVRVPGERAPAPPNQPVRVLIVATQATLPQRLEHVLGGAAGIQVVGRAETWAEALAQLAAHPADVTLVYRSARTDLPARSFSEAGGQLPLLVVVDGRGAERDLAELLEAGAWGVLPADATDDQLLASVWAVAAGLRVVRGQVPALGRLARRGLDSGPDDFLTEREMQVLQLVARGLPNKGIARRLGISEHTVKFHVGSILAKLGAESRTEAVTQAAHRGLLTL